LAVFSNPLAAPLRLHSVAPLLQDCGGGENDTGLTFVTPGLAITVPANSSRFEARIPVVVQLPAPSASAAASLKVLGLRVTVGNASHDILVDEEGEAIVPKR
jgi:hypothetical protein